MKDSHRTFELEPRLTSSLVPWPFLPVEGLLPGEGPEAVADGDRLPPRLVRGRDGQGEEGEGLEGHGDVAAGGAAKGGSEESGKSRILYNP